MSTIDLKSFESMLPSYADLNEWQQYQYDMMLRMCEIHNDRDGMYNWVAGHSGSQEDFYFRKYRILRAHEGTPSWTYCCGVTMEHFMNCWRSWMDDDYESDIDMTLDFCKELLAYFFVYDDPPNQKYKYGCAKGIEALGHEINRRWEEAKSKAPDPSIYDDGFDLTFNYHTDPYKAKFGDYVQLQPHADPLKAGHSAIFVCMEKRERNGVEEDCIRVFNSNTESGNGYGYGSGIGLTWYWLNKYDNDGFRRVLHFGSVEPVNDIPSGNNELFGIINFSGVFKVNLK